MALDPVPYMVGNGAEHSVEIMRSLAYASTSGAEGIVTLTDLRVQALATPGTSIRVSPGSALIRNRYSGGAGQSYALRNATETTVPVTATTSAGGRTDLVVARVLDPQYEGNAPADSNAFDYSRLQVIQGVPSNTKTARDLGLTYPAIALARITIPASTATITNAMITDLRQVAIPRVERRLFAYNLTGATVHATSTTPNYWPEVPEVIWNVDVPLWASTANIVATLGGVRVSRSAASGVWWVRLGRPAGYGEGNVNTQHQKWALDFSALPGEEMRESWVAGDDVSVPAALRGTNQPIRILAHQLTTGGPARLDNASSMMVDIEFRETAA